MCQYKCVAWRVSFGYRGTEAVRHAAHESGRENRPLLDENGHEQIGLKPKCNPMVPGEVRATWDEIDTAGRVWTIPATRMKMMREHRVPLSGRASGDEPGSARSAGTKPGPRPIFRSPQPQPTSLPLPGIA